MRRRSGGISTGDEAELLRRFGQHVRAAREACHLTQHQLAGEASCSQALISRVENGSSDAGLALCGRIASALGKSLVVAFVDAAHPQASVHEVLEIVERLRRDN